MGLSQGTPAYQAAALAAHTQRQQRGDQTTTPLPPIAIGPSSQSFAPQRRAAPHRYSSVLVFFFLLFFLLVFFFFLFFCPDFSGALLRKGPGLEARTCAAGEIA